MVNEGEVTMGMFTADATFDVASWDEEPFDTAVGVEADQGKRGKRSIPVTSKARQRRSG